MKRIMDMRLYAEVSWVHLLLRGFWVEPLLIHYLRTIIVLHVKRWSFLKKQNVELIYRIKSVPVVKS